MSWIYNLMKCIVVSAFLSVRWTRLYIWFISEIFVNLDSQLKTNYAISMMTEWYFVSNDRENEQLSKYGDTKTARSIMLIELKKLIEANPLFRDKLLFPTLKSSRLRTLINQRYMIKQVKTFYWFFICKFCYAF